MKTKLIIGLIVLLVLISGCVNKPAYPRNDCPPNPSYTNTELIISLNQSIINKDIQKDMDLLTNFFNNKSKSYDSIKDIRITYNSQNAPMIFITIDYSLNISEEKKYELIEELKNNLSNEKYFSMIWFDGIDCLLD